MADPHRKDRYGEIWNQDRLDLLQAEIEPLKDLVTLSGGWAWHFLSPAHTEYKHLHDHKDIDVFVEPPRVGEVVSLLYARGFAKVRTKYDHLPSEEEFRRYEKHVGEVKVTIDFFVRDVPSRLTAAGFRVVEPAFLLGLYRNIHSSDKCFAVLAAKRLLEAGIDPQHHPELVVLPSQPA